MTHTQAKGQRSLGSVETDGWTDNGWIRAIALHPMLTQSVITEFDWLMECILHQPVNIIIHLVYRHCSLCSRTYIRVT